MKLHPTEEQIQGAVAEFLDRALPADAAALQARIEANSMPEPNSGCWLWLAASNGKYGKIHLRNRGRLFSAHRVSYMAFKGEIPDGLIVRHRCDVGHCVNPDHLDLGTYQDNTQDAIDRGRAVPPPRNAGDQHWRIKRTHCVNGHEMIGENVAARENGWRRCAECDRQRTIRRRGNR